MLASSCSRSRKGSDIHGQGLFANENVPANTIIAIKPGRILRRKEVLSLLSALRGSHQQIDWHTHLGGISPEEVDRNLVGYNHRCDPNARVVLAPGIPLAFLVTRDAIPGGSSRASEIGVDYSVANPTSTHRIFECNCHAENCRKTVNTGWDWLNAESREKNRTEFPSYVRQTIKLLESTDPAVGQRATAAMVSLALSDTAALAEELEADATERLRNLGWWQMRERAGITLDVVEGQRRVIDACTLLSQVVNLSEMGIAAGDRKSVEEHLPQVLELTRSWNAEFVP